VEKDEGSGEVVWWRMTQEDGLKLLILEVKVFNYMFLIIIVTKIK